MYSGYIPSDHVTNYLDFYRDPLGSRPESINNWRETCDLPSGSQVHRIQDHRGLRFQLFLNKEEYEKIEEHFGNSRAHFYGGYYILLPESCSLMIPIARLMGWVNLNKESKMYPELEIPE